MAKKILKKVKFYQKYCPLKYVAYLNLKIDINPQKKVQSIFYFFFGVQHIKFDKIMETLFFDSESFQKSKFYETTTLSPNM